MDYAGNHIAVQAFEHPPLYLFLRLNWRKVSERQEIVAFEMSAFVHELLAALVIDHPRHCTRERPVLRVAGSARSDQVRVQHPPAPQAKDGIKAGGQRVHLRMRG